MDFISQGAPGWMSCSPLAADVRPLVGILGVMSRPGGSGRMLRDAIRQTWLSAPRALEAERQGLVARFVLRAGGDDDARKEAVAMGDTVLLLDVLAAMAPKFAPLRSTLAFLQCALKRWPRAASIGHAEDDVYLVLPDIVQHLRRSLAGLHRASANRTDGPRMLWGMPEVFHWSHSTHLPHGWWSYWYGGSALARRSRCAESRAGVVGPFGFAKGALYFLSADLAEELQADERVGQEAEAALRGNTSGGASASDVSLASGAWEDVFIGFALSLLQTSARPPLHYVSLPLEAYHETTSATAGLSAKRTALVMHATHSKSSRSVHRLHQYVESRHCTPTQRSKLSCGQEQGATCGGGHWHQCELKGNDYAHCESSVVDELGFGALGSPWLDRDTPGTCAWRATHQVTSDAPLEQTHAPQTRVGYCASTDFGGDCENDVRGAWNMGNMEKGSFAICVAMCACCARCRYVSYSTVNTDCSWHHACNMDRLQVNEDPGANGHTYTTVAIAYDQERGHLHTATRQPEQQSVVY